MASQVERSRFARADWLHAGAVAALVFALYAATAPRSVIMEDDGLFILSSYFLGIEHPPGYPLFTLIGHLFTFLPFGSVAYRVHLVSAVFGALTCGALWLCARALAQGRLAAYVAALALGASPVFWSQSLIADVYSFNTFFFLSLLLVGLHACPPDGAPVALREQRRMLAWFAFIFGLSLSNHWPLMLLVAPGFAVLLWPLRYEMLRRVGLLIPLFLVGLLPYVWMVYRSRMDVPISFAGPLDTWSEIWHFLSREGYSGVDHSVSANWLDRLKFFRFTGGQLLYQFALVGTLLAAAGFATQWQSFGRRVSASFTLAFLGPTAVLLLLLDFDYSRTSAHVFHVYPLPAYCVAALWLGLGFAWVVERRRLRRAVAAAAGALVLAIIFAVGAHENLLANYGWVLEYAEAVMTSLPKQAVLVGQGEADLAPVAYLHLIEQRRPDITLYQSQGLILGNRLFHPLRTDLEFRRPAFEEMIARHSGTVAFTMFALENIGGHAQRDRWLYVELDKSSADPARSVIDIPEDFERFFEQSLAKVDTSNAWIGNVQNELRRRYAGLLARSLRRDHSLTARQLRHIQVLEQDYYGALGLAEGFFGNPQGYSVGAVARLLDRAGQLMPSDAAKPYQAQFFHLRGILRTNMNDANGAMSDFETALSIWPAPGNPSIAPMKDLYRQRGDNGGLQALEDRIAHFNRTSLIP